MDLANPRIILVASFALLLMVSGCAAPVTVTRVDPRTAYRELSSTALARDRLSEWTRNVLRRWDLLARFDTDPDDAIAALRARVIAGQGGASDLFALAEMSYLQAHRTGAKPYYLAAAIYAYAYLFPRRPENRPSPYDPRFRDACDLYNLSLASALISANGSRVMLRPGPHALPFGTIDIALDKGSLRWGDRELADFVPTADLRVRGLRNLYRNPGLGAPLAASTLPLTTEPGIRVAPKIRVPATVLLVIRDVSDQVKSGHLHGLLSVRTIFGATTARIQDQTVPLEYDQTAALALGLAQSGIWSRELGGFFSGTLFETSPDTLVAVEPHVVGRIPVVFLHGTASSAGRWADMLNDLLDDPTIAEHFEFWFFSYATGNPIPYSALLLREQLQQAVDKLGGDAADPALRQMVLIGHSQGGLIAKMLVIDPGARFWNGFSRVPLRNLKVTAATRDLLRRMFFIHPVPEVKRVIFIATPQHGSFLAGFSISRFIGRLVTAPLRIARATAEVLEGNRHALAFAPPGRFSSVHGMSPGSPLMRVLAPIPIAPGIAANSIIAVLGNGPAQTGDDGVVTYASAHIPGVQSELVVRSGHSTQSNPQTIAEVRRILLVHLATVCPRLPGCAMAATASLLHVSQ